MTLAKRFIPDLRQRFPPDAASGFHSPARYRMLARSASTSSFFPMD